jgi:hypothetical protein
MKTLNVIGSIVIMTMLVLAGIYLLVAASSLVQSASATDVMNTITDGAVGISNNNSNDSLGNLVYVAHGIEETVNPVNDTYIVISYVDSVTLMPPNSTTGNVINVTERGNFTSNILSSGLSIDQGQGLIMTEGSGGQQETATITFASLSHSDPEGATGSGTGAAFFSTNSTGRLAFLNNMVGIAQVEFSPEGSTVRIWEWKGVSLALENGSDGTATENQSISTS